MKNIYELGLDFINSNSILKKSYNFYGDEVEEKVKPKVRRRSRHGLETDYKSILKRYHNEKKKTEELKNEIENLSKQASKLADKYDVSYNKMKELFEKMEKIRNKLNRLDDSGDLFLSPEEEPEELDLEKDTDTDPDSNE